MFLSRQAEIDKPFEVVEQTLALGPNDWLSSTVESDGEPGEVRMMMGGTRGPLSKEARLRVGGLHSRMNGATLPLRLEATGPSALFPRLDADLDITPLEDGRTRLTMRGSYAPPLGRVGEMADRMLLHRLAEKALQGLLDRIATLLRNHSMS